MKIIIVKEPPCDLLLDVNTVYDVHHGKDGLFIYNNAGRIVSYHVISEYIEIFDEKFCDIESV